MDFLNSEFLGNSVRAWLVSVGLLLALVAASLALRNVLIRRITKYAKRTETSLDDAVAAASRSTKPPLLFFLAVLVASRPLNLPERVESWVEILAIAGFLIQVGFWTVAWLDVLMLSWKRQKWGDDPQASSTFKFAHYAVNVGVWSVILLLLLENLGVDISALVAGLGIGGIAVALALQSILGDLFASLSILLDKPFVIGDYLAVDDLSGTVQTIGLNTTRLTSLTGEQLVFSNKDLLQSRIRNYGRMEERRVLFRIGVVYGTAPEVLQRIPQMIQTAVEGQEQTRFDRSHFKEFGDSALAFETVYYMTVPDYKAYMDVQEQVNLAVMRSFESAGIEFAYPTQHVFLETVGGTDRFGTSTSGTAAASVDGPGDDK